MKTKKRKMSDAKINMEESTVKTPDNQKEQSLTRVFEYKVT